MSEYRLDEAFRTGPTDGLEANRVVVRSGDGRECSLPAGANAANVLGITVQSQPRQGRYIAVRRAGFAHAIAAGAIAQDAPVCAADAAGRVRQLPYPTFNFGVVAQNNALVCEWLDREHFSLGTAIKLVYGGGTTEFAWAFIAGALEITLTGAGGDVTETANTLIAAVADDETLSRLVRFTHATGSSGAGTLAAQTAAIANPTAILHPIGIAQETAAQAGDVIIVKL